MGNTSVTRIQPWSRGRMSALCRVVQTESFWLVEGVFFSAECVGEVLLTQEVVGFAQTGPGLLDSANGFGQLSSQNCKSDIFRTVRVGIYVFADKSISVPFRAVRLVEGPSHFVHVHVF